MDPRLLELLSSVSTNEPSKEGFTHMTLFEPREKWSVKSTRYQEFWEGYCNLCTDGEAILGLAERNLDTMPVIVDLQLQFSDPQNVGDELYGQDFVLACLGCIQHSLHDLLAISESQRELYCVVLESSEAVEIDKRLCVSFRFQFPYCRTEAAFQTRQIRPRLVHYLEQNAVMARLATKPDGKWEDIVQATTVLQPVTMYRSRASCDDAVLELNGVYGVLSAANIESGQGPVQEIGKAFSPSNHSHVLQRHVSSTMFLSHESDHWLPMYLSIHYFTSSVVVPKKMPVQLTETKLPDSKNAVPTPVSSSRLAISREEPIQIAERLLLMLGQHRKTEEHFFLDVGKALYTLDRGRSRGLELWSNWAAGPGRSEEQCRDLYPTFNDNNRMSLHTIAFYAREDSRVAYDKWHVDWYSVAIDRATSCLHGDVAEALYKVYWLDFACASIDKNVWYSFHDHRWHRMDGEYELRREIAVDFVRRIEGYRLGIAENQHSSTNEISRDQAETLQKKISGVISRLKTFSFKQNLIREARIIFYRTKFSEWVDQDNNLMGMNDCVLEVCGNRVVPRNGKPEDFVSKSCGVNWPKGMTDNHPQVVKLNHWIRQVFTDDALRHYVWKTWASVLRGGNSEKKFYIWTGEGDNSKSMVVKLFEAALGVYCIKFPTSLLTGKRTQSSAPMPELAQAGSAREAFLQEPDDDETIRGGILKELTGGDTFFARLLHDNGGKIKPSFGLVLMCNKIPAIPTGGKAVRNRLCIIPFMSTWIDNPPESEEEQFRQRKFKKNPLFEAEIPKMAQAFLYMLVKYFPIYMAEKLVVPDIVRQVTSQYWTENDVYALFLSECVAPAVKENGSVDNDMKVTYSDMYKEFKQWFKETYPGTRVTDGPTFKSEIMPRLGRMVGGRYWTGIRIVTDSAGSRLQSGNQGQAPAGLVQV